MNHHYRDIRDKLGPPSWWDESAVPRYVKFSPHEVANIYAKEVVLLEIACQSCGHLFEVAMSTGSLDSWTQVVEDSSLGYGDPPNVECCAAGPTMNSDTRGILQFWRYDYEEYQWRRIPELERVI